MKLCRITIVSAIIKVVAPQISVQKCGYRSRFNAEISATSRLFEGRAPPATTVSVPFAFCALGLRKKVADSTAERLLLYFPLDLQQPLSQPNTRWSANGLERRAGFGIGQLFFKTGRLRI